MVMAAGLGTRLRPLTYAIPKPMVSVANRPIMEHLLMHLPRHGFDRVAANLHWFPETIREHFGDGSRLGIELTYSQEEKLLGTAGGVRNVAAFFDGEPFLVMAADALTDIDLTALWDAHAANDGIATLAVKPVEDTRGYGVVVTGADGRVQGFQEKPDPAEALSDRASCMIYILEPEVFDYFPDRDEVDFALDVFPALLESDVPFYVHEIDAYWNDVGSLPEYLRGNLDVIEGAVAVEPAGDLVEAKDGEGPILLGAGSEVHPDARLEGPLVVGDRARIGAGAAIRESVLLPGSDVPPDTLLAGAIYGPAAAGPP
jgi:mannose-1-phosphate guanylyltransferase/mannose-1-phosphate guanylyltransferase/phosphomannomutase